MKRLIAACNQNLKKIPLTPFQKGGGAEWKRQHPPLILSKNFIKGL
ncbi:hypothetical protein Aconfl_18140 [Algoriphagus confluentis]|uniref:Uncharacterized protein n=1 Tax=Algoriphagus confluentis TaxID=1697556 RepID=A0ABQ6PML5_9BACT|nr:hypothetical protein Aconfl_18140 [Algoriphagus confluentis]